MCLPRARWPGTVAPRMRPSILPPGWTRQPPAIPKKKSPSWATKQSLVSSCHLWLWLTSIKLLLGKFRKIQISTKNLKCSKKVLEWMNEWIPPLKKFIALALVQSSWMQIKTGSPCGQLSSLSLFSRQSCSRISSYQTKLLHQKTIMDPNRN